MEKTIVEKIPKILFWIFAILWLVLALNPVYRFDWFLENLLVFAGVPFLIYTYRKKLFSNNSYVFIFLFLSLHIIGAHYTYSEVPIGTKIYEFFGWERNHYDRFVHFLAGLLLTYPVYELIKDKFSARQIFIHFVSACIIAGLGIIYELLEWGTAIIVAPEAGTAFLGTQGDEWDAQKDLALKIGGSFISVTFSFFKSANFKVASH